MICDKCKGEIHEEENLPLTVNGKGMPRPMEFNLCYICSGDFLVNIVDFFGGKLPHKPENAETNTRPKPGTKPATGREMGIW